MYQNLSLQPRFTPQTTIMLGVTRMITLQLNLIALVLRMNDQPQTIAALNLPFHPKPLHTFFMNLQFQVNSSVIYSSLLISLFNHSVELARLLQGTYRRGRNKLLHAVTRGNLIGMLAG